jgi:hypothetical protein
MKTFLRSHYTNLKRINLCDPDLPCLFIALLIPVILTGIAGKNIQAHFYFGTAVYVITLKWIGWLVLGRDKESSPYTYPLHIFTGLGIILCWFYLRNAIGKFIPLTYGVWEIKLLPLGIICIHLFVLIRGLLNKPKFDLLIAIKRIIPFFPYVMLLHIVLKHMAKLLNTASTDPLVQSFLAHAYLQDGVFTKTISYGEGEGLIYPSSFAAINAITSAISTLSASQAVNLQHPFILITALYLVTSFIGKHMGRSSFLLLLLPFLFLWCFPVHNLYPTLNYEGTPRQASIGLFIAITFMPLYQSTLSRATYIILVSASSILTVIIIGLNPSCIPFAAAFLALGIVIDVAVQNQLSGRYFLRRVAVSGFALIFMLTIFLSVDPYLKRTFFPSDQPVQNKEQSVNFSLQQSVSHLREIKPLQVSTDVPHQTRFNIDVLVLIAILQFALCILLYKFRLPHIEEGKGKQARAFCAITAIIILFLILLKYTVALITAGVSTSGWYSVLLKNYLLFNLTRSELVLWYTILVISAGAIILCLSSVPKLNKYISLFLVISGLLLPWLACRKFDRSSLFFKEKAGIVIASWNTNGLMHQEDVELTRWVNENIKSGAGWIGLGVQTFTVQMPSGNVEQHIYPIDGAQAYFLYSYEYNFCFTLVETGCKAGFNEYVEHVKDRFDAQWLKEKRILYFIISDRSLRNLKGYREAIEKGSIHAIKRFGDTAIYKLKENVSAP